MPTRPPRLCPGCRQRVPAGSRCPRCTTARRRETDARRPSGAARGWTREWAAFVLDYLRRHPTCESPRCAEVPWYARPKATDVDHLDGHSRTCSHALDERVVQALCHPCHSRKTVAVDGGFGRTATALPRCER